MQCNSPFGLACNVTCNGGAFAVLHGGVTFVVLVATMPILAHGGRVALAQCQCLANGLVGVNAMVHGKAIMAVPLCVFVPTHNGYALGLGYQPGIVYPAGNAPCQKHAYRHCCWFACHGGSH